MNSRTIFGKNNSGTGIVLNGSYGVSVKHVEINDATKSGAGEGYGILITGGTTNYHIFDVKGRKNRHLIDCAQSSNGLIENVNVYQPLSAPFVMSHNSFDADITFRNCHSHDGSEYAFYYGSQGFKNAYEGTAYGFTLRDCSVKLYGSSNGSIGVFFNAVAIDCVVDNFTVEGSYSESSPNNDMGIRTLPIGNQIKIKNFFGKNLQFGFFSQNNPYTRVKKSGVFMDGVDLENCETGIKTLNVDNIQITNTTIKKSKKGIGFQNSVDYYPDTIYIENMTFNEVDSPLEYAPTHRMYGITEGHIGNVFSDKESNHLLEEGVHIPYESIFEKANNPYFNVFSTSNVSSNYSVPIGNGMVEGESVTIRNVGNYKITMQNKATLVHKNGLPYVLNPKDKITYIWENLKWVEV